MYMEIANAKKIEMQVESIEEVKFDEVKKSFAGLAKQTDLQLDPDLMYARFIMCHEGTNANGDTFTKDVLQRAQYTPRFKPIDWEHGQPFIGTILDSQYNETDEGVAYIEAIGAIWKFHYPDLADKIKAKSSDGGLKLSMECFYRDANYQYGDQIYTQEQADSLGLPDYVGREYMGKQVKRVFSDVIFGGVGVVANPADKDAVFLSVAKKKIEAEEVESAVAELHPVNDYANKQVDKDTFSAVTVAKYMKAFDKAKSAIVSKFNKSKVATKNQVILEVKQVLEQLVGDIKVIEQDYYKGNAGDNDPVEDLDLINYDDFINEEDADSTMEDDSDASKSKADENDDETMEDNLTDPDDDLNDLVDNIDKEEKKQMAKDMPKKEFDNKSDEEVKAENKLPESSLDNKEGEDGDIKSKEQHAENKLPKKTQDNKEGEDGDIKSKEQHAGDMEEEEAKQKPSKSNPDPDNDGDDDTTPDGDKDNDYFAKKKKKASEIIAELESSLANMTAKFEALQEKVQASEKKIIASKRVAELEGLGIEFSEARKAKEADKVSAMNQADFDDYKSFLCEIAGVTVEKAEASVVVEEVTVEDVDTASAGLNVETQAPKVIKPFGHLAD